MRDPERLAELGAGTLNVWRRADALRVLTPDELRHDLDTGVLRTVVPGVLVDGGSSSPTAGQWLATVVLASSGADLHDLSDGQTVSSLGAVGCGRTAARVDGMPLIDDDDPTTGALDKQHHDVCVFRELGPLRSRPRPGVPQEVVHRYQLALEPDQVRRHDSGAYVTVPAWTLYHLTALVSHEALVCAIDWCLHHAKLTRAELDDVAERCKGRRHAPGFRRALALSDGRAESPHETLTRLLLTPDWPELRPQVLVRDSRGVPLARFDHADLEIRLAVESDGKRGHSGPDMKAKDDWRDRRTREQVGFHTERVTWPQVRLQQAATRRRVLAVRDQLRAARGMAA